MWQLAVVYDSDKRYLVPFSCIEQVVDEQTVEKIKTAVLKEVQKIA